MFVRENWISWSNDFGHVRFSNDCEACLKYHYAQSRLLITLVKEIGLSGRKTCRLDGDAWRNQNRQSESGRFLERLFGIDSSQLEGRVRNSLNAEQTRILKHTSNQSCIRYLSTSSTHSTYQPKAFAVEYSLLRPSKRMREDGYHTDTTHQIPKPSSVESNIARDRRQDPTQLD